MSCNHPSIYLERKKNLWYREWTSMKQDEDKIKWQWAERARKEFSLNSFVFGNGTGRIHGLNFKRPRVLLVPSLIRWKHINVTRLKWNLNYLKEEKKCATITFWCFDFQVDWCAEWKRIKKRSWNNSSNSIERWDGTLSFNEHLFIKRSESWFFGITSAKEPCIDEDLQVGNSIRKLSIETPLAGDHRSWWNVFASIRVLSHRIGSMHALATLDDPSVRFEPILSFYMSIERQQRRRSRIQSVILCHLNFWFYFRGLM